MTPPFFTWSFNMARAAVVPGAPTLSRPISSNISATLSPHSRGSGQETGPRCQRECPAAGSLSCHELSHAGYLESSFLDHLTQFFKPFAAHFLQSLFHNSRSADTYIDHCVPSVTPRNAPAINGLSSGALQKITSFAQPSESLSLVASAEAFTISPQSLTASILMPVFVDPTFTELADALSLCKRLRDRADQIFRHFFVILLDTRAE